MIDTVPGMDPASHHCPHDTNTGSAFDHLAVAVSLAPPTPMRVSPLPIRSLLMRRRRRRRVGQTNESCNHICILLQQARHARHIAIYTYTHAFMSTTTTCVVHPSLAGQTENQAEKDRQGNA